jgi:hypothetical protein
MMEMKVSMDGLRRKIVSALARLTKKLNESVDAEDGMIHVEADYIRGSINELQSSVVGLCCVYEDDNEMFTNMCDYVEENLPDFDPQPEEDD